MRYSSLARFSYLHHSRIANEIPEFRDYHPIVMITHKDPIAQSDNPFTGNDRFVFYEDGGRPIDIQLQNGWRPTLEAVENIARQLLDVLSYLRMKNVVHRKLSLGTIVRNQQDDVKLISLGDAKYIGKLDYEEKVHLFTQYWTGHESVLRDDKGRSAHSSSPPVAPKAQTRNKVTKKYDCAHPDSRCCIFVFYC